MVYSRHIDNQVYTFGVSGRLYKSNVLLYDHQTESLWSQLLAKAVSGPLAARELRPLPAAKTTWKTWQKHNPHTTVLSTDSGYRRDYTRDPYEGYDRVGTIWFPVGPVRADLPAKARILGIQLNGEARAYSLAGLTARPGIHEDRLGGVVIRIEVSTEGEVVGTSDLHGKPIPHIFAYWFAWQAFHPQTTVYLK